jgi:tetratricopeptide (TPR) repeat protein
MDRYWIAIGLAFAVSATAQAGFYDPRNPTSPLVTASGVRPLSYDQLRDDVNTLLAVADSSKPKGPRAAMLKRRDELLARGPSALDPTAAAELGVVQWRLRDTEAALTTLRAAANRDPRNFWVLTHLGSVYQALGQDREASSPLEAARDAFPEPWPVGPPAAGDWFKKAEGYQLKLLRLRLPESSLRTSGRPRPAADVDALFPVKFTGPDGQYTAGRIDEAERKKLPADAVAVIQQLLLWFPEDTRLLWLLGELYNAEGNLEFAAKVLDDCVWQRRYESPALREHRRMLQEAYEAQAKAPAPASPAEEPPKPVLLPGTWQMYAVAVGFGVVLLILAYFQIAEFRRRRRGPVPPST